jgi:hypothetical protein
MPAAAKNRLCQIFDDFTFETGHNITKMEKYVKGEQLGRGQFGVVYKAVRIILLAF